MRRSICSAVLLSAALSFSAGCQAVWNAAEPVADTVIPPTNPGAAEISSAQLAEKIGKPDDFHFFGNQAVYRGDRHGYRYLHLRDMTDFWGFLGEPNYKIKASDWPMEYGMRRTRNANHWVDVTWMNGDAPPGVAQNAALYDQTNFPIGAPRTQPATPLPPQRNFETTQDTSPQNDSAPATAPATASAASQPQTTPASQP